ncbi:MAG: anthranilate phosphoribosyltransferase [Acidobacteria bacterium]|nr:MAG: anthranilate phosphoribosyltransferase [Acidobacteriota bacterium]
MGALVSRRSLSKQEARAAMDEVVGGRASDAQIAALLVGLRSKGETAPEIAGMVEAMLGAATTFSYPEPVLDTCGTGGDRHGTFNVSTCAAFICAGAGAKVAKHGNRAASSQCGSADVLEALGVEIELGPEGATKCLDEAGIAFLFARRYHPAMRHAAGVRGELGVPTVMNFLGPLSNPARAQYQAVGVSSVEMAPVLADSLEQLGARHALVFCAADGLDELSIADVTRVFETSSEGKRTFDVTPDEVGVVGGTLADIKGGDARVNAEIIRAVLDDVQGPPLEMAVLNAAAGIVAAGLADGLPGGVGLARESISSGRAKAAAENLIRVSQQVKSKDD